MRFTKITHEAKNTEKIHITSWHSGQRKQIRDLILYNVMSRRRALPNPSLKQQVSIGFQTNASLEEALKSIALPVEAVDDVGPWLDERGLEHVGKERQN